MSDTRQTALEKDYSVVITGPPRSGTTMVQYMLTDNPLPECSFLTRIIELYQRIVVSADKARFRAYLGDRHSARRIFRQIVQTMLSGVSGSPLILKDPEIALYLPYAKELLPDSTRFLGIVRDPRDVVASMKRVRTREGNYRGLRQICTALEPFYQGVASNDLVTVRYEDVVRWEPETIRRIETHTGLTARSKETPVDLDKSDPFYSNFFGRPVTDKLVSTYYKTLDALEIELVESLFKSDIKRLGYNHNHKPDFLRKFIAGLWFTR